MITETKTELTEAEIAEEKERLADLENFRHKDLPRRGIIKGFAKCGDGWICCADVQKNANYEDKWCLYLPGYDVRVSGLLRGRGRDGKPLPRENNRMVCFGEVKTKKEAIQWLKDQGAVHAVYSEYIFG